jgi:transposase InsO family protein
VRKQEKIKTTEVRKSWCPQTAQIFVSLYTFREYGLPDVIRTDNGVPFCAAGSILGLSTLSVWFLKLGIALERSRPGKPQDNGAHERMHRTLKQEVALPPRGNEAAQQRSLNRFRRIYNEERPITPCR